MGLRGPESQKVKGRRFAKHPYFLLYLSAPRPGMIRPGADLTASEEQPVDPQPLNAPTHGLR